MSVDRYTNPKAVFAVLGILSLSSSTYQTRSTSFVYAFSVSPQLPRYSVTATSSFRLYSSVGDDNIPPPGNDDGDQDGLDDFLTPREESENLKQAREYLSETSLPISFDVDTDEDNEISTGESIEEPNATDIAAGDAMNDPEKNELDANSMGVESSALVGAFGAETTSTLFAPGNELSAELLAKNPYMQVVSKLSPSELISKFTASANPRVQEAVRSTVLGLIGSLPKMAFDTTTITTGQRLASLMFQLQMTGYMFKNAEYRLSLSQSLGMTNGYNSNLLLEGDVLDDESDDPLYSGKVKGKLKIRYGDVVDSDTKDESSDEDEASTSESSNLEIEVDAAAYMSELRAEVSKLKDELDQTKGANEEALRKDLLLYIRTLPAQELKSLTNTMSQDVMVCMKGLVQAVLGGIGDGQIGPETVTEQSGEAMAQLCMWQLAVGYNLRELEVREEMKKNMQSILDDDGEGGVDFSQGGSLE